MKIKFNTKYLVFIISILILMASIGVSGVDIEDKPGTKTTAPGDSQSIKYTWDLDTDEDLDEATVTILVVKSTYLDECSVSEISDANPDEEYYDEEIKRVTNEDLEELTVKLSSDISSLTTSLKADKAWSDSDFAFNVGKNSLSEKTDSPYVCSMLTLNVYTEDSTDDVDSDSHESILKIYETTDGARSFLGFSLTWWLVIIGGFVGILVLVLVLNYIYE